MASQRSERLATSIAQTCTKVKEENQMKLCTLPLEKSSAIANRYSLGKPNPYGGKPSKTILVMGATGSGKTTWINAMINYVLGVEWDDPFRFMLVEENLRGGSQAHSQTQGVTVYDIHHQNGFRVPFSLTIVDTPGFGDTKGMERDKEITSDIGNFFKDKNGIEVLPIFS
jgi:predicted GTPase